MEDNALKISGCYMSYADKPAGHKSHSAAASQKHRAPMAKTMPESHIEGEAIGKLNPVSYYDNIVIPGYKE